MNSKKQKIILLTVIFGFSIVSAGHAQDNGGLTFGTTPPIIQAISDCNEKNFETEFRNLGKDAAFAQHLIIVATNSRCYPLLDRLLALGGDINERQEARPPPETREHRPRKPVPPGHERNPRPRRDRNAEVGQALFGFSDTFCMVNSRPYEGFGALHIAIWQSGPLSQEAETLRMVTYLLEHGADPNLGSRVGDATPLHFASRIRSAALLSVFASKSKVKLDFNKKNAQGETPLHCFLFDTHMATMSTGVMGAGGGRSVGEVLGRGNTLGADPTPEEVDAVLRKIFSWPPQAEALDVILNQGADPRISGKHGLTAYHMAAALGLSSYLKAFNAKATLSETSRDESGRKPSDIAEKFASTYNDEFGHKGALNVAREKGN